MISATDIGNLHVIDWYLHRARRSLRPADRIHWYACIIRYIDGEEELSGAYR